MKKILTTIAFIALIYTPTHTQAVQEVFVETVCKIWHGCTETIYVRVTFVDQYGNPLDAQDADVTISENRGPGEDMPCTSISCHKSYFGRSHFLNYRYDIVDHDDGPRGRYTIISRPDGDLDGSRTEELVIERHINYGNDGCPLPNGPGGQQNFVFAGGICDQTID